MRCLSLSCEVCTDTQPHVLVYLQALAHLLEAAAEQQKERLAKEGEGVVELVQRWMFNLVKKGLTAANLAVRQVLPFAC